MKLSKKMVIIDGRRGTTLRPETTESMATAGMTLIIEPDGHVRKLLHEDLSSDATMNLAKVQVEYHTAIGDGALDGQYEYTPGKDERMERTAKLLDEQKEAQGAQAESPLKKFGNVWGD